MNKISKTILFSLAFFLMSSLTAYVLKFLPEQSFWCYFGSATAVLAVGAVLLWPLKGKGKAKLSVFFINAVAMGVYLRSWYKLRGLENSLWVLLLVAVAAASVLTGYALLIKIRVLRLHYKWFLLAFCVLGLAGYVTLLILTKTAWLSTFGFYGIFVIAFILSLSEKETNADSYFNHLVLASYSIIVCAVIILIIALEGDFDVADFDFAVEAPDVAKKEKKPKA